MCYYSESSGRSSTTTSKIRFRAKKIGNAQKERSVGREQSSICYDINELVCIQ